KSIDRAAAPSENSDTNGTASSSSPSRTTHTGRPSNASDARTTRRNTMSASAEVATRCSLANTVPAAVSATNQTVHQSPPLQPPTFRQSTFNLLIRQPQQLQPDLRLSKPRSSRNLLRPSISLSRPRQIQRRPPLRGHTTKRIKQPRITVLHRQTATNSTLQPKPKLDHRRLSISNQTITALNQRALRSRIRIIRQRELRHRQIRLIRHILRQNVQPLQMRRRRRRLKLLHISTRRRSPLIIRDALNPPQHHLPRRLQRTIRILEDRLIRPQHPHLRERIHIHMPLSPDQRPQSSILEIHDRPRQTGSAESLQLRPIRQPLHRHPIRVLTNINNRPTTRPSTPNRPPIQIQDELRQLATLGTIHHRQKILHRTRPTIPHTSRILSRPEMDQRIRLTLRPRGVHSERRTIQHRRRHT